MVAHGYGVTWVEVVSRILRRSLGRDVDPELVGDLVSQLLVHVPPRLVALGATDLALVTSLLPQDAGAQFSLDRFLIGLCWLVFVADRVSKDERKALSQALVDDWFQEIMVKAPTFAWLPATALLTFRYEQFSDDELEAIEEACLTACLGVQVGSMAWLGRSEPRRCWCWSRLG